MRILFIGNSHTYGYGMPYQCREMLKCLGVDASVGMVAQPGQALAWHASNPATKLALQYDDWDHVILQQATHPFQGHPGLLDAVKELMRLMRDGQPVWFYKTWCEKEKPENQEVIDRAFEVMSVELGVPVIPVSDAWHAVERKDPGHDLYDTDARHAGPAGSYLTALCIARALSGKSVLGLPAAISHGGRIINEVPARNAGLYQSVVDAVVRPGR